MIGHLRDEHANYEKEARVGAQNEFQLTFTVTKKASNIFSWLRWISLEGLLFPFVEDNLTAEYTKLKPITRQTFVTYLEKLTLLVERQVAANLPEMFGFVFDGWTDFGTSTHYFAIFACYAKHTALLAFSPLGDEEKYDASPHAQFIEVTLALYQKPIANVAFFRGG